MSTLSSPPTPTIDRLAGRRVLIVGLARQGLAMARFGTAVGADIVVTDLRPAAVLQAELAALEAIDSSIPTVLGEHPVELLDQCDIVSISGSVPLDSPFIKEARARGLTLTNDSLEFMRRCRARTTIGITGSAGKTTVTSLVGEMARLSGRSTWVGGNIGHPLLPQVEQIGRDDIVVQELSSFQLDLWTMSPAIAGVLNITPNHLDRHHTMASYTAAKANIVAHQSAEDTAVLGADDPRAAALAGQTPAKVIWFGLEQTIANGVTVSGGQIIRRLPAEDIPIAPIEAIQLRGRHNLLNVLAACALASAADIPLDRQAEGIKSFSGVPHRLEPIRQVDGIQFINDSIATAPERALAAIAAFTEPLVLLAGGRDKNMVWDTWAETVAGRVDHVILFGALTDTLREKLAAAGRTANVAAASDLAAAVGLAHRCARPGSIVLLSPGGTSYDSFRDFAERGQFFRDLVNAL